MTLDTLVHIKKVQSHMLEIAISGHAYLADHGQEHKKQYHAEQAVELNREYRDLNGHYYLFHVTKLKGGSRNG